METDDEMVYPVKTPEKAPENGSLECALLQNAALIAEIGMDLKEKCVVGKKHLSHLKVLFGQANRAVLALQATSKVSLQQAKKLLATSSSPNTKQDREQLLALIDRQLEDFDDTELDNDTFPNLGEKLKFLESRYKPSDNSLPPSGSSKSIKGDTDEKYPENWSRDSSIDLSSVINLPPVPEDVFTSFSSSLNKPKRSSSLSSLKSMRKVKLFLQRAENSDDDEASSDAEDHEFCQKGDSDDGSSTLLKKHLGNIKEETQDNYLSQC